MIYRFHPLLKQTLWGGDKIIPFKHITGHMSPNTQVGESWEISGVAGCETVVCGGPDDGKPLNQLVREQRGQLVGEDNYQRFGDEFPLLIKFIDACHDLSIQVHPSDETAHRLGKSHGKSEMWYVLGAKPGAQLYNGLRRQLTPEQYKQMVADDQITEALAQYSVASGDVFFIPGGRIHSIGAGCFVCEIQQTSDITYRIYDFRRRDKDGNYRQLHTHEAAECIDYGVQPDYRTDYERRKNEGIPLVSCQQFTTALYDLQTPDSSAYGEEPGFIIDYSDLDSFVILIAVGGEGTICVDGETQPLQTGDTLLLPATTREVRVAGTVKFLETYV